MLLIVVNSGRSGRKSKSLGIATRWLVNPIRKLRKSRYFFPFILDLIVKTSENLVVGEDDDDLNEGFCHYSIMDDE